MLVVSLLGVYFAVPVASIIDDEFERWQNEVKSAEAEVEVLNNDTSDTGERDHLPPDGEEEFTDDDGTTYKWDRVLGVWVPQVSCLDDSVICTYIYTCVCVYMCT